ncbi:MAG: DUF5655 domain-containing protein [Cyclobacteriaceae bacterium]|nr:DUF4287 domain-containing protein [Cyclobacteriaceae bacterium]MCB0500616.1 DUF4287 domain-containing protein [Cyclobacteriaceae bacterium]MCB9237429.1 DUF4287 domain-containing protein [Flammeovirgaceae bacterium]MCO5273098.1 DUF5655 domain-containing protein [Cyclobacteriaceae bacterium]MCW5903744.1 DUF4287 domain-containing protein [Cyclobacteriaceae bacterium]
MAKTSKEIEQEFINGLKTSTGNDLKTWLSKITKSGFEKRNDIIKWLKKDYGFGHMHASLLVGIYANGGKPVYASGQGLLNNLFEKHQEMFPIFDGLKKAIHKWDDTVDFIAKKTYVSIAKNREFAAINIKNGELRLGIDLGDRPFDTLVAKSKLTGPMPRISHMVVIKGPADINKDLLKLLETANKRINP